MNSWPHRWRLKATVPRFLRNCLEPFRGEVLEIGAGSGWTSRQILETFPQVELTATDIDPDATKAFEQLRHVAGLGSSDNAGAVGRGAAIGLKIVTNLGVGQPGGDGGSYVIEAKREDDFTDLLE
jgi:hypothetical protein